MILVNFEETNLNPNVICLFKGTLGILGQNFPSPPEIFTVGDIKPLIAGITTKRQDLVNKIISDNYMCGHTEL